MTLVSVHVSDIGQRSLLISLGGETFGLGVKMGDFRSDGMYPILRDCIWMFRMTGVSSGAKSLR